MSGIRVLVVDDSIVARQVIIDAIKAEPALEVVGVAGNGKVALSQIAALKPDVITLDMEMPEMDGFETLKALRLRRSTIPVIVFAATGERGARLTLDALAKGANDFVCKPSGQRTITATMGRIRDELVPRIVALHRKAKTGSSLSVIPPRIDARTSSHPPSRSPHGSRAPSSSVTPVTPTGWRMPPQIIVIGVSTGGPTALSELICHLPASLRVPILVVQHMPPVFTRVLAQRLAEKGTLPVREAAHQDRLEAGTVLIAPGDHHMRIAGNVRDAWVTLDQSAPHNGCRPAADPLFDSAARIYGRGALAIVMTGLGQDGTHGAQCIRDVGGAVWVQDEASCAAGSMPASVVRAGLASRVVRLGDLAREIVAVTGTTQREPHLTGPSSNRSA